MAIFVCSGCGCENQVDARFSLVCEICGNDSPRASDGVAIELSVPEHLMNHQVIVDDSDVHAHRLWMILMRTHIRIIHNRWARACWLSRHAARAHCVGLFGFVAACDDTIGMPKSSCQDVRSNAGAMTRGRRPAATCARYRRTRRRRHQRPQRNLDRRESAV